MPIAQIMSHKRQAREITEVFSAAVGFGLKEGGNRDGKKACTHEGQASDGQTHGTVTFLGCVHTVKHS